MIFGILVVIMLLRGIRVRIGNFIEVVRVASDNKFGFLTCF